MSWKYRNDEVDTLGNPTLAVNLGTFSLAAATTLTAADNGKTFVLALAGGFTVTLPNIAGFFCEFIVGVAPTTAYIIAAGTADTMAGTILSASGAAEDTEAAATGDKLNFVATTAVIGDRAKFNCDGTRVFAFGICSAAGGITIDG